MQPEASKAAKKGTRRIWWAVGIGTILQAAAFLSLTAGTLASTSSETESAGPAFALGFMLVPVVCAVVAFVSGNDRAPIATLKGMGAWLVVALPLGLANPIIGIGTGFAASAAFTLKTHAIRPGRRRFVAVLTMASYLILLLVVLPQSALFAGAATPLFAVRTADYISEHTESSAKA